jgi:hypothetical protein
VAVVQSGLSLTPLPHEQIKLLYFIVRESIQRPDGLRSILWLPIDRNIGITHQSNTQPLPSAYFYNFIFKIKGFGGGSGRQTIV